ncbi:MAG: Gfo/Idh/MocA family oxidoreductase [Proteobacteria bacterium]|nr:Gfo/Idh/MocA family oxidoreductase [Pseudomonadota bacterium]
MTLRVAVIGAGYFAQFHHAAWDRLPGVELVAIADRDAEKAGAAATAHGLPAFTDYRAMLDVAAPDLVDIATPPASHLELVTAVAARGLPAICQKPLAPRYVEAVAVVEAAERAGSLLVVHENFRFQPWYREMHRLIAAGQLGDLHGVAFRLRPGDGQGAGAYLDRQPYFQQMERFLVHETAIHFIDTFRYLLGEVVGVMARLRRLNPHIAGEDAGLIVFDFAAGQTGLFDGNRLNDHVADNTRLTMGEMWLEGSAGVLRLDGGGRLWWKPHGGPEVGHAYAWSEDGFAGDSVYALQAHILAHLQHGGPLENRARDYLRNLEIEDAVYRSARENRYVEIV